MRQKHAQNFELCSRTGACGGGVVKHIVKRHGHNEIYDEKKLYASVYSACLSVRQTSDTSELIAQRVIEDMAPWIEKKHEVTSNDIRRTAAKHLETYNPDAAQIFLHHRVLG